MSNGDGVSMNAADEVLGRIYNESFLGSLERRVGGITRADAAAAMNALSDYTRTRMREDGILRRVLAPALISEETLNEMLEWPTGSFRTPSRTADDYGYGFEDF